MLSPRVGKGGGGKSFARTNVVRMTPVRRIRCRRVGSTPLSSTWRVTSTQYYCNRTSAEARKPFAFPLIPIVPMYSLKIPFELCNINLTLQKSNACDLNKIYYYYTLPKYENNM